MVPAKRSSFILLALLGLLLISCAGQPQFKGRDFSYGPAPDFRLEDQDGQLVSLSDQRGKVVVLTFMYTNCRDVCPLTAAKFSTTYDQLSGLADHVTFVAISSDPENDTLVAVRNFTAAHHLEGKWHYLLGTRRQLEPIWKAYFVAAQKLGTPDPTGNTVQAVIHSSSVVLIDAQGAFRIKYDSDFDPADLASDVREFLNGTLSTLSARPDWIASAYTTGR